MRRRLFLTSDCVGGVWQYSTELARELNSREYEVTIAILGPSPTEIQRRRISPYATLIETNLPLDWTAPDSGSVIKTGAKIARLADLCRADLVQINQPALMAEAQFHAPVAVVAHSCVGTWWAAVRGDLAEPASFNWQTDLVKRGLERADVVIAPSHSFADALKRRYALSKSPRVVHNARSAPLGRSAVRQEHFAFTVGRLWDEGKDAATLDRAAARLSFPFKAAGSFHAPGGQAVRFENFQTLGCVDDAMIADCLSAQPVFVSAARYEPFGLAVLEAALAGCPLVLSDIPTFREFWDGAATFVRPQDAEGFANAINKIITDPAARLQTSERASRRAQRFSPDRMGRAMDALFSNLLAGSRRGAAA